MKSKRLLLGILAVVLPAGGGAAYYFLHSPNTAAAEGIQSEPAAIVKLDPFITNIADDRRTRVEVALAVAPIARSEQVQSDALVVARLRDKILTMLAASTYEDLSSPQGKEDFRKKVRIAAQQIIADAEVREALFVDFVIQ